MIDATPPPLWLPARPAIIRAAEPWEIEAHNRLVALGVRANVRRAVVAEIKRLAGARRHVLRPALADLARYADIPLASFLPGLFPGGAAAAGPATLDATLTVVDDDFTNVNQDTQFDFTGLSIGAAAADRYVAIFVGVTSDNLLALIVEFRIDGVPMTLVARCENHGADTAMTGVAITAAPWTSGTTADFELEFITPGSVGGDLMHSCGITVCTLTGVSSPTPYDVRSFGAQASVAVATVLARPANSAVGAVIATANRNGPHTWTGLTENVDFDKESSDWFTSAFQNFDAAETDMAVSVSSSDLLQESSICVVSWGEGSIAALDPDDISGLVAWYRSDLGVTKDGSDIVSAWADQSGTGKNLSASSTLKPTWFASQVNSHSAIRFDGVNDALASSTFTALNPPFHVFTVLKLRTATNAMRGFRLGSAADAPSLVARTTPETAWEMQADGAVAGARITVTTTDFFVTSQRFLGAGSSNKANNIAEFANSGLLNGNMDQVVLGAQTAAGANPANVDIAEIVVYNADITGAELTGLMNYFKARYALWS